MTSGARGLRWTAVAGQKSLDGHRPTAHTEVDQGRAVHHGAAKSGRIGWVVGASVLVLAGCTAGADESGVAGESAVRMDATLDDYSISLSGTTVDSGTVAFDVTNQAEQVHEFVVARTDLDAAELPTDDAGDVSEEGASDLSVVDEIEDIEGGTSPTLTVDLDPGHYVVFCNLPGHYRLGMHTDLDVS